MRTMGLIDTGPTGTGIRADVAEALELRAKGQRRVHTANGMMMAAEYLVRIGFVCGDYRDPDFVADRHQPYVLDKQYTGFALQKGVRLPLLIGMDILGEADLSLYRDGDARLHLY
ncbi:aspartyl protease family protein [Sphingomonas gilva]|nr:aspartyl protease family protein [Sphingomonas gilva]